MGAIVCAVAGACGGGEDLSSAQLASLAVPGPWVIPDDVRASGDEQFVEFTGAGPWQGEEGCGGGLLEGTAILREYVGEYFPQAYEIGGYSCRPIVGDPANMSVHATGRALDIMIYPVGYPDGSEADNEMGDPIGNWLIVNAERIGIQQIIWDRWLWRAADAPGEKDRAYTGEHPHNDHLHVELSVDAAGLGTPFFQDEQGPPVLPSCGQVPAEGGLIDEIDRCAELFGPPEYWRAVDGAGEGGSLLWTDAFESAEPSNWARWILDFAAAGRYRVEYHAVAEYAIAPRVRHEVRHGAGTEVVYVDQGAADGWVSLGEFDFAAGGYQSVAMFDNADGPVEAGQHIVFDALRVTPCDGEACGEVDPGSDPGPEPEPEPGDDGTEDGEPGSRGELTGGGCASAGGGGAGPGEAAWMLPLVAALIVRRRRR
jgi:MYXO-CTERM domain-containing protein